MEALILDRDYMTLAILDNYESFIWNDKYQEAGDFELVIPANQDMLKLLAPGNYLSSAHSEHIMIIEDTNTVENTETGGKMTFTGRSLESLLDRRVAWTEISTEKGNLQDFVEDLLNKNAIQPEDPDRIIPGLVFKRSTDPNVTTKTLTCKYHGETLYDIITTVCNSSGLGFKMVLENETTIGFYLYCGVDRSYKQDLRPFVVFSPDYENFLSSEYYCTTRDYKTVCLVLGPVDEDEEGNVIARHDISVYRTDEGAGIGLDRREVAVDSSSTKADEEEGENLNDLLQQDGQDTLADAGKTEAFSGEVEAVQQFVYPKDFDIGDICSIQNSYGQEAEVYIAEVVFTSDASGEKMVPTFMTWESHDVDVVIEEG